MKSIVVISSVILLAFASAAGIAAHPTLLVIGGQYTIPAGQTVDGNVLAMFAQLTIEEGASVNGDLIAHSSLVDLRGRINQNVRAVESNIHMRASAAIHGNNRQTELFGWPIIFPRLVRIGQ